MRRPLAAAFVLSCFCVAAASAGTITSISPSMVKVNSGEQFLTIYGSGLGSTVVFDGPGGHFELQANAFYSGSIVTWVPLEVTMNAGYYDVYVRGGTGDSNVVTFEVRGFRYFPMVLLLPEYLRVQPINREGAYAKYEVIVLGGEDPEPSVSCTPESGSFFKMGQSLVQCEAWNSAGERASGSFTVHVRDEEPPIVDVPLEPIRVKAQSNEGSIVEYKTSAYDEIWGELPVECTHPSGSLFHVGLTTVQCHATDVDLNVGYGSFIVEVVGEVEPYELTIHVADILVNAESADGTYVKYEVEVSGTEDPEPRLTCTPESGSLFRVGTNVVQCDVLDRWGMRGSASFLIEVADPEPPLIEKIYATPDILEPADGRIVPVEVVAYAYDAIDAAPVCEIYAVTSNQDIHLGDGDDPKSYDWLVTGKLTLELRAEVQKYDRLYDIWVGCSDYYGNRTNTTVRVTVPGTAERQNAPASPSKKRSVGRR